MKVKVLCKCTEICYLANYWSLGLNFDIPTYSARGGDVTIFEFKVNCQGQTNSANYFNVDIMLLYISAMDYARKLKFSSYVHLPSINNKCPYIADSDNEM